MADKFLSESGLGVFRDWILGKLGMKQDTLVSGTNLKTVNGQSLLGSGNIDIQGGGGSDVFVARRNITTRSELLTAINEKKIIVVYDTLTADSLRPVIGIDKETSGAIILIAQFIKDAYASPKVIRYFISTTDTWTGSVIELQENLVSGVNIKTVGGSSLLGNGDVELPVDQAYDGTSVNAQSGVAVAQAVSTKADLVPNAVNGEVLITDASGQPQSSGTDLVTLLNDVEAGKEAFMLKDFNQQINITIPSVTQDVANTSIPNMDIDLDVIDPTGDLNTKYAIAGIVKYEIYDATSGGNRLNAFPVCSFSMNGQRTLRLRCMVGGPSSKTARRVQGALLLKHR